MVAILLGFKDINQDLIGPLSKHVAHIAFSHIIFISISSLYNSACLVQSKVPLYYRI